MPEVETVNGSAPQFVLEEAGDEFAPRTRKATSEALTAVKPHLEAIKGQPDKVFTIAKGLTDTKAAALVSLLNGHYPNAYTFSSRTAPEGGSVVQARYSTTNLRPVRTVKRDPAKAAERKASKTTKAAFRNAR